MIPGYDGSKSGLADLGVGGYLRNERRPRWRAAIAVAATGDRQGGGRFQTPRAVALQLSKA